MERELKINRVYRHFKGKEYIVLGVSEPVNNNPYSRSLYNYTKCWYEVVLTEVMNCKINIFNQNGKLSHWRKLETERLVIYMALYGDYETYARPYEMFMSEIEPGRHSDCNKKYRLELVKD